MNNDTLNNIILRTKLHKPHVSKNHLHRQGLLNWLDKWVHRPLTLVSAPAGYGKSALLSYWLNTSDLPSAWVSLDNNENDLFAFLSYLLEAVQTLFPDAVHKTNTLLNAPNLPPLEVLAHSLINELDQIDQSFILVLDDYHSINDKTVHRLISVLLQHPPAKLHLVIASRLDPPFGLSRLRARRLIGEIRIQDLRFSSQETKAFLEQEIGMSFDNTAISILEKKIEGWVTGLCLAVLTMRSKSKSDQLILNLPIENHYVTDYLVEELLLDLSPEIQDYLLSTSILDRFNESLCDAVCTPKSGSFEYKMRGADFLKWLETSELFVVPLDDQRKWYRYHHLFQKLLLRRLKGRISQEEVSVLYGKASQWFADNNLIDEAIRYSLAGEDTMKAVKLVEKNRHIPLNEDKWIILERWLKQFPDKVVQQRPKLLMAKAWVLNFQFKFSDITLLLEKVRALDYEDSKEEIEAEIDLFTGFLLYWEGNGESSMELIIHALGQLPATSRGIKNEGLVYFAAASQMSGEGEATARMYQKKLYNDPSEGTYKHRVLASLIFIYLLSGELAKADEKSRQFVELSKNINNPFVKAWAYYLQGIIHYQLYSLDEAIHYFSMAVENVYLLSANASIDSYAGLILSYQASQQPEKATNAMNQMIAFAEMTNSFEYMHRAYSIQARLHLLQGHLEKAVQWQVTADFSDDTGIMFVWLDVPRITQCRILAAQSSETCLCKAEEKLLEYLKFNQATRTTPQMIEILLLLTIVYKKQGKINEAMTFLNRGVALAFPGNYIHAFVNHLPGMTDFLKDLSMQGAAEEFIRHILSVYDPQTIDDQNKSKQEPWGMNQSFDNPLTSREIEVLLKVSQGLSNKDVAARLYISPETVKKHTINIYEKLDVHNRQQAVLKANNLGLLK